MTVEVVTSPQDLVPGFPRSSDPLVESGGHLRALKVALKTIGWEHCGAVSASASASLGTYATHPFVANFDYQIVLTDLYFSTTASTQRLRVSTGGGTDDTGANYSHAYIHYDTATNNTAVGGIGGTSIELSPAQGDATTERTCMTVTILAPASATNDRVISYEGFVQSATTTTGYLIYGGGVYNPTTAVDGLTFYPSSGTITAGTLNIYRRYRP